MQEDQTKKYKITIEHFEIFKKEIYKWIDIFGLKNWEISIKHKKLPSEDRAETITRVVDRIASIVLNEQWLIEPTENNIKKTAFHEICEVLLARIDFCMVDAVRRDEQHEARHELIRILENILFPIYLE